ncbi:glycosyltransferase family 2 protein [Campylobacter sp. MG1]|uniref:glycosyltransferase family 2 protein n=1 Tax=Campylobacter sp. MG1 TaxID=2976332 RepID=UPI00226C70E7|nr:glycosyltransferase family 2 protein [Campylobacter sp. MG1]
MLLSVIIPTYNSQKFLKTCIKCLKQQLTRDIEFIFINDGSTDNSLKIIEYNIKNDNRFKIYSKKNTGYGDSCNYGISISKGKYIAIFEPDDYIPKDFYSELINNIDGELDIIKYNGIYKVQNNQKSRLFNYYNHPKNNFYFRNYKKILYSHPSITNGIYKRDFIQRHKIKFCTGSGASYQDEQFRISIFYTNPLTKIIDKCKYEYIIHGDNSINYKGKKLNIQAIEKNWQEQLAWVTNQKFDVYFNYVYAYRQMLNIYKKTKNYQIVKSFFKIHNKMVYPNYFYYLNVNTFDLFKYYINLIKNKIKDFK